MGSGGLFGAGFMRSQQKLFYLPEPHSDFIFAVIGEELGMGGCLAVLAGFRVVLWRGLRLALRIQDPFGTYLCLGLTLLLVMQRMINMGVVSGLAPTKGIALPLLSSGGTGWALTAFCVGLLVSMDRASAAQVSEAHSIAGSG